VIVERLARPASVSWYLAGFPKKSTLNSMNPRAVSCLITQRVVHSELSLIASSSSALLSPSLLFPMAVRAAVRCGDATTFLNILLCAFRSEGQTQSPLGMDEADWGRFINPACWDLIAFTMLSVVFSFDREVNARIL